MIILDELYDGLNIISFETVEELHNWFLENENISTGIWVRLFKKKSKIKSISFHDVLEEGLCFGWSESLRYSYDDVSYLQKISPRKSKGTQSSRNLNLVKKLERENRMRPAGYSALGL